MTKRLPMHRFVCPKCKIGMTIRGHEKDAWNYDPVTHEYVQRFYVSCPCAKKIMGITHRLEPMSKGRKRTNFVIHAVTKLINLPTLPNEVIDETAT